MPLDPYQRLVLERYATKEAQPMADQPTPSPVALIDPILKRTATRVGRIQVLVGAIVALVVAIIAGTIYVDHLASRDDVKAEVATHAAIPGHPAMVQQVQGVNERLIRVELLQGTMDARQQRMEATQLRTDDKIDHILEAVRFLPLRNATIATNPAAPPIP
jgi:hypothetical protein